MDIAYREDTDIEDWTIDSHEKWIRKKFKKIDDDIEFHKNNFKKDPTVITILTDKSKINIDKILDYGELIELNKEIVFN